MIQLLAMLNCLSFFCLSALATNNYKSQAGQDQYVNEIFFKNKRNGVFIDIGAHDGVSYSNTWFYEKILGWTGICIECNPQIYNLLAKNRSCTCICGCISDIEGSVKFRQVDGHNLLSGIESKLDAMDKIRLENLNANFNIIDVPSYRLNNILEKNKIYYADFLSLDVEGGELDILKTIDFDRFYISIITVENNYQKPDIALFLESKGFRFITRLHVDDIYLNITLPKGIINLPKN